MRPLLTLFVPVAMRSFASIHAWLLLACCGLAGCGTAVETEQSSDESPAAGASEVKKVPASKLPKLGDYLPPLDSARLEAAPPKGWLTKGKGKDYVCAFAKEKNASVPAIVVKVSDPTTGEQFSEVNSGNVAEFAAALQGTLQKPLESAIPMMIGDNAFARYVKGASINGLPAEVQVLATVHDGRMYAVELRVRPEELKKYRDDGYAVAAGLKFSAGAKPFEFKPEVAPGEAKDKPAEAKPAETKSE
jgi:hypothetical protein